LKGREIRALPSSNSVQSHLCATIAFPRPSKSDYAHCTSAVFPQVPVCLFLRVIDGLTRTLELFRSILIRCFPKRSFRYSEKHRGHNACLFTSATCLTCSPHIAQSFVFTLGLVDVSILLMQIDSISSHLSSSL
jgi:hypothetical protein